MRKFSITFCYFDCIYIIIILCLACSLCDGKNTFKNKINKAQRMKDEENVKANLQTRNPTLYNEVYNYFFYPRGPIYEYLQSLSPSTTEYKQITRALKRINASIEILSKLDDTLKDEQKEIKYDKVHNVLSESSEMLEDYDLEFEIEIATPYCNLLHKQLVSDFEKKKRAMCCCSPNRKRRRTNR